MMEERSTKPDMEAAQQLVQLSGGEEKESKGLEHSHGQNKKEEEKKEKEEEGDDLSGAHENSGKGKEEEVEEEEKHRLRKRKRFRSLASIYRVSKPISNGHHGIYGRKKRLQRGKEEGLGD